MRMSQGEEAVPHTKACTAWHWCENFGLKTVSITISLLIACWVERLVFTDPYAINDDVRNQAYWMLQLVNPHLFSNDLAANYFTQPALVSPLLKSLYSLASHWMSPIRFSQFLPFALAPLTTALWFLVAERWINQRFAFWSSLILNCAIWMTPMLAGGLPRAFFYPLVFLFFWAFSLQLPPLKKSFLLSLVLIIQSLIYPPTLLLSSGLLGFDLLRKLFQYKPLNGTSTRIAPRLLSAVPNILAIITGISSSLLRYAGTIHTNIFGPLLTGNIAEKYPEFYVGGRVPVFSMPMVRHLPENTLMEMLHYFFMRLPEWPYLILLLFCLAFSISGRRLLGYLHIKTPQILLDLPWVALILYTIAVNSLFYLYVPMRYLDPSLSILIIFLIGAALYWLEKFSRRLFTKKVQLFNGISQRLAIAALLTLNELIVAILLWKTAPKSIYPHLKTLFITLNSLPVNIVELISSWQIIVDKLNPGLGILFIFLLGLEIGLLGETCYRFFKKNHQPLSSKFQRHAISGLLVLITLGFSISHWKTDLIYVFPDQQQLFSAIKNLPEKSRISASYWSIANNIPVFSERAVLINREVNIPFHRDYYKQMKIRFLDWLKAYYTDDPQALVTYIEKYQIDYLVASTTDFTESYIKNREAHFTKDILPSDFIGSALQKQKKHSFWLTHIGESPIIGTFGPYLLIDAKRLLMLAKD
jgi:hypothetical protein